MKTKTSTKGFSLIEMLIYVSVLAIVVVAIIAILVTLTKSHRNASSAKLIQANALFSIDRMTKEIQNANSIDSIGTTLGSNPGRLKLNTTDTAGNDTTVEFYLTNGVLKISENSVYAGQLTSSSTVVSNLVFYLIDQSRSDAIKMEMELTAGSGAAAKTERFYTTVILRDSY